MSKSLNTYFFFKLDESCSEPALCQTVSKVTFATVLFFKHELSSLNVNNYNGNELKIQFSPIACFLSVRLQ